MENIIDFIKDRLKKNYPNEIELPAALALVANIESWNIESGKSPVESKIKEMSKGIEAKVSDEIKKLNSILEEAD